MSAQLPSAQLLDDPQRLRDLVRYCRVDLHQAALITEEEYAVLAEIKGAVKRIVSYDQMRERIQELERDNRELLRVIADLKARKS